jgi:hypothetical protein
MTTATTSPLPAGWTFQPLLGWEDVLAVLLALVGVALLVLVAAAGGTAADGREDWQAWLDARATQAPGAAGGPAEPGAPEARPGAPEPREE